MVQNSFFFKNIDIQNTRWYDFISQNATLIYIYRNMDQWLTIQFLSKEYNVHNKCRFFTKKILKIK